MLPLPITKVRIAFDQHEVFTGGYSGFNGRSSHSLGLSGSQASQIDKGHRPMKLSLQGPNQYGRLVFFSKTWVHCLLLLRPSRCKHQDAGDGVAFKTVLLARLGHSHVQFGPHRVYPPLKSRGGQNIFIPILMAWDRLTARCLTSPKKPPVPLSKMTSTRACSSVSRQLVYAQL